MDTESLYLLNVLKSFVTGEKPASFQGDWGKLIRTAHIHNVLGILGYVVMTYSDQYDEKIYVFLRQQCMATIKLQAQRAESMRCLIEKLNEQEIDHLLFKGYVVKECYPIPELRTYGDIDFLIRREDRLKSDILMMEQGFLRKTDWEPVYSYYRDAEFYEIHTDVMEVDVSDKADFKGYFQNVWSYAQPTEGHTYVLSKDYHFLYLLTHIAKHIHGSGAGIRMYLDIAFFLKAYGSELKADVISVELEKLCFSDFVNMVLTIVQRHFGIVSPISLRPVDEAVLNDFMEFTMAGGIFGRVGRDSGVISLKAQARDDKGVSKTDTLRARLFPSAKSLENRYTYLRRKPWLLPVAWVHRLFKTKEAWGQHVQEARNILSADREEVLRLKRIYKEIGL